MQSINDRCAVAPEVSRQTPQSSVNNFWTATIYLKFLSFPELQVLLDPNMLFFTGKGEYI